MLTRRDYVCSGCWSELVIHPDKENPRLDIVACPNCDCPGYVSKSFVKKKESNSVGELIGAKHNLREALPTLNKSAQKTLAENITDLYGG